MVNIIKCNKCGSEPQESDKIAWKCNSCGKSYGATISSLSKVYEKKNISNAASIMKCKECGTYLDDGNEKIYWKCSCGNVQCGKLDDYVVNNDNDVVVEQNTNVHNVNNTNKLSLFITVCVVFIIFIGIIYFMNKGNSREMDAWVCAMHVAEERLKSPSTAKFCSFSDASITDMGDDRYKVQGYVDAENSFGVRVKTEFTVTLTLTKSGYKDESCKIDDSTGGTSSDTDWFHFCIVDGCIEYGSNSIIGISGETEYYCNKHYQEMKDNIEKMLGN